MSESAARSPRAPQADVDPRPGLDALRAAMGSIQAGGRPRPRPPTPSPDATPSDDGTAVARPRDRESRQAGGGEEARDPHAVARAIVLRQLENSPKTRSQLAAKLAERGCDRAVAEDVLDRLTEVGLIDDAAYAEMYVRSRQVTRGLSRQALAHDLRRKGVAEDIASDVLDRVDPAFEGERARQLVRARLPRLHGLDRDVQIRRLAGLLTRKGYGSGLVMRVVLEELDLSAEHRRD
ncbi:MAG: regulatory protein RecX [Dermatophilaceae bacterium]